jgi:hypothetical protein
MLEPDPKKGALAIDDVAKAIDGSIERFRSWALDAEIAAWYLNGELPLDKPPDTAELRRLLHAKLDPTNIP